MLLLTGSNAEAAELSRRVQARLAQTGAVSTPQAALALAHSAELAYAGNFHVAQGRTVDTAHLLVTESLSRQALYVGMTRGREANTAHVVTGQTAPPGHHPPCQQVAAESVLASVLQRDADDLSATEQIRHAQEWADGTGHLLQDLQLPDLGHAATWAQRTPDDAPQVAHELAAALDERRRELGERLAAKPEPWLTRHLGVLPPDASPALREDYAQRAGTAAAYREARGITDPQQAVSFGPHPDPELAAMQRDTFQALEIVDEQAEIRAMSHGELEARVLDGDRAQAAAPPDLSARLRLTAQAEADAWQQVAAAAPEHDLVQAHNARALANQMAAEKARLEAASARYEKWSAKTASTRETAGKAKAELQRRGQKPAPAETLEPQSMLEWWQELQANSEAVDRALARQQQAAADVGRPWPPVRHPAAERSPQPGNSMSEQREILKPKPDRYGERTARLDELQARVGDAAARVEAQRAELDASSEYTARMEREVQAAPEADWQPEAPDEIEIELQ